MKHVGLILLVYVACIFQTTLAPQIAVGGIAPRFLLLVLAAALLTLDNRAGLLWAALIGLLSDCLTAEPLGIDMTCSVLAALVVRKFLHDRPIRSAFWMTLTIFLIVLAVLLASTTARVLLTQRPFEGTRLLALVSGSAAYSALLGLTLLICWRLMKRLLPRRATPQAEALSNRWKMLNAGH